MSKEWKKKHRHLFVPHIQRIKYVKIKEDKITTITFGNIVFNIEPKSDYCITYLYGIRKELLNKIFGVDLRESIIKYYYVAIRITKAIIINNVIVFRGYDYNGNVKIFKYERQ